MQANFLEMQDKKSLTSMSNDMRIIGQFDANASRVREIFSKYWGLLLMDEDACNILPLRPLITYKRGRNLRDRPLCTETTGGHLARSETLRLI